MSRYLKVIGILSFVFPGIQSGKSHLSRVIELLAKG